MAQTATCRRANGDHEAVAIEDRDLTTVMAILGDIREDVSVIRELLEDDDGEEEETPEEDT